MPWLVELKISHYRYSIGGEHYYGKLDPREKWTYGVNEDGSTYTSSRDSESHPIKYVTLTRPIRTHKEAAYLSKKDNEGFFSSRDVAYKKGEETYRFDTKEEILPVAISFFNEKFDPEHDILVYDPSGYHEEFTALAGNQEAVDFINANKRYQDQHRYLNNHGFTIRNPEDIVERER